MAIVTMIAAFAGRVDPVESKYISVLGMALPLLLICNILFAVFWMFGRKRWALVPLVALLFNYNYFIAIFQFGISNMFKDDFDSSIDGHLKIATYNVGFFGGEITGYSCKRIAKYMKDENVDILCFQECDGNKHYPIDSIRKVFAHWKYEMIISKDSIKGILPSAIFSRHPLINQQLVYYNESVNNSMVCDVIMGNDTILLLNNHLQTTSVSHNRRRWERHMSRTNTTRQEVDVMQGAISVLHDNFMKRAKQTDTICRLIEKSPYPVVACGDFNSLPSSYTYSQLSKRLKDGFKSCGSGYMYTFRYYKRLLRIDYIFHSPSIEGLRYYSPNLDFPSDHKPVLMEMNINKQK